jgi:hypothetical protein
MAKRNRNDPAKTQAAACLTPKATNSQVPEAMRGPTARDSARSVEWRRRLSLKLFKIGFGVSESKQNTLFANFPALALNRAYDRFTSYDNPCEAQNAALPCLSWRRLEGRNALHCL